MKLRDYQLEAVDAVYDGWQSMNRVAIEVATGAGKTVIVAEVVKRTLAVNPKAKIVFLAHRGELLRSGARTISAHNGIQVGIVDGQVHQSVRKKNLEKQIVCINTATLGVSKNARSNGSARLASVAQLHAALGNCDLVILDECHRANTDTTTDCLIELGCFDNAKPTRLLGVTATLFRGDKKMLTDVFEACVYKKGLLDLIAEGYLVDIIMKKAHVDGMDLTKVATSRSMSIEDFNATSLDKVMEEAGAEGVIAEFAKRYCDDRKTLIFTPTVASAERVAKAFGELGLGAVVVHGSMKPSDRAAALDSFENGGTQYLINCMILTEGVDLPACSAIIMARPTKSQQLYLQILGRALRLHPEKENALIIDLVGATSVNGMVSANEFFKAENGETALEAKEKREQIERVVHGKALQAHALLNAEEQEEFPIDTIVSGSFNLFDVTVEEAVEQIKRAAKESKERKERERVKKLPAFPAPGRCGSLLELDFDYLISLESWATLPQYKGSYAAVVNLADGKLRAFFCDTSKPRSGDRYGFIGDEVTTFEEVEQQIVDFTKVFPGTAGAVYYAQNKLDPNNPKRNKKASADQIKFMGSLLKRAKIKEEEWNLMQNKQMKQPPVGVVMDWIDYLLLCRDAREQCAHIRQWYKERG